MPTLLWLLVLAIERTPNYYPLSINYNLTQTSLLIFKKWKIESFWWGRMYYLSIDALLIIGCFLNENNNTRSGNFAYERWTGVSMLTYNQEPIYVLFLSAEQIGTKNNRRWNDNIRDWHLNHLWKKLCDVYILHCSV